MRNLLILMLIIFPLYSHATVSGSSMSGGFGVSGILKRLLIPSATPIGSLSGTYGYEVWDLSDLKPYTPKRSYCSSGFEFSYDANLIGISFGGGAATAYPVGKCNTYAEAEDGIRGDNLTFSVGLSGGKGSKAIDLHTAFGFGMNLKLYNEKLIRYFSGYPKSVNKPSVRLKNLHLHMLSFLALSGVKAGLNAEQVLLIKLLSLPVSLSMKQENFLKHLSFSKAETNMIVKSRSYFKKSFKQLLGAAFYDIRRSADFYTCAIGNCEEIALDFLSYSEILLESIEECHSLEIGGEVKSEFAISAAEDLKFSVGLGYASVEFDKTIDSHLSNQILALREYAGHNFNRHSKVCDGLAAKSGETFGTFLGLWGYGK